MESTIDRGNAWRRRVVVWAEGFTSNINVRGLGFKGDDIRLGDYRISLECKNTKAIKLAEFLDQADSNAPAGWLPIVAIKRRGKASASDGYAVMSMNTLEALILRGAQHPIVLNASGTSNPALVTMTPIPSESEEGWEWQ